MKQSVKAVLWGLVLLCIFLPVAVVCLWSVSDSWAFPGILPAACDLRGLQAVTAPRTLQILASSIAVSALVGVLSTLVGTLTARALVWYDFPGKQLIRFFNLLPLMIPAAAFAMGVHVLLIQGGLSDTAFGVILVHLICGLPYSVNSMYDATEALGKSLEEQAASLGCGPVRAFFETSLFGLLPGLVTSFCMAYIVSFSQYFITLIIGGGNVQTLSTLMVPYIQSGDRTISGAYGMLFLFSTLLVLGLAQFVTRRLGAGRDVKLYD